MLVRVGWGAVEGDGGGEGTKQRERVWGSESGAEQKERRLAQPPLAVLPTQKQDMG